MVHHLKAKAIGVLAFGVVVTIIFLFFFVGADGKLPFRPEPYTARVILPNAFQLVTNSDVRLSGLRIGSVSSITNRGSNALVEFEVEDDHAPLYRDATVQLRTKSLLGENYLDIERGDPTSGALESDQAIPLEQVEESATLDEILSALDDRTRASLQDTLDELGGGLDGSGRDLNRLLAAAKPTTVEGGRLMGTLDSQRDELTAILGGGRELMQALADRSRQLRGLIGQARATAEAVSSRDRALAQTIELLPSTLRQARSTVGVLGDFSGRATPVVEDLRVASSKLKPVLDDLEPTARQARTIFRALEPVLEAADPALEELDLFSGALAETTPGLDALLREARPMTSYLEPFAPEVGSLMANLGSFNKPKDAVGHKGRILNYVDERTLSLFTEEQSQLLDALGLQSLKRFKENSYPDPGTAGKPGPPTGPYPRVGRRTP